MYTYVYLGIARAFWLGEVANLPPTPGGLKMPLARIGAINYSKSSLKILGGSKYLARGGANFLARWGKFFAITRTKYAPPHKR